MAQWFEVLLFDFMVTNRTELTEFLSFVVMKKPLYNFSKDPMPGFYRDGYCIVGPEDTGNHSVAGASSATIQETLPAENTHHSYSNGLLP